MTRQPAEEAIATAVVATLRADAGVTALASTRTYTRVPQTATKPYLAVSFPTARRMDTASRYGAHTLVDVSAVTEGESERTGVRLRSAVIQALNGQLLTLTAPFRTLGITWDTNRDVSVVDGADVMTDDQYFVIASLLTEIRDLLAWRDVPASEVDETGQCLHPEALRVAMGHTEWICRRCRYQFSGVDHAQASL
jgi:hypothetical protein